MLNTTLHELMRTLELLVCSDARYLNVAYRMYQLKHETESVALSVVSPDIEFKLITSESQWSAIKDKLHGMSVVITTPPILLQNIASSNVFSELEKLTIDFFITTWMTPQSYAKLWEMVIYSITGEVVDMVNLVGSEYDFFLYERWILTILLLEMLPAKIFGIAGITNLSSQ